MVTILSSCVICLCQSKVHRLFLFFIVTGIQSCVSIVDGYEATRDIRQWEQENSQERIPIVALSANVMSDVAQKCMDCGFSTYISKPVNFATLSDVIRKHLLKS